MTQNQNHTLIAICKQAANLVQQYLAAADVSPEGKAHARQSLDIIREALDRFRFDELALSFNGGKDCLVLLVLLLAGLAEKQKVDPAYFATAVALPCVYVKCTNAFSEVDAFVASCNETYGLRTTTIELGMKDALAEYLLESPHVRAIFVGIRRTDPFGNKLQFFQKTDHGWPDFMRIHPVINWELKYIWEFIRYSKIEYCPLYDQGYTSLGGTDNTTPNPALKVTGSKGVVSYLPAYTLEDDLQERLGRV